MRKKGHDPQFTMDEKIEIERLAFAINECGCVPNPLGRSGCPTCIARAAIQIAREGLTEGYTFRDVLQ